MKIVALRMLRQLAGAALCSLCLPAFSAAAPAASVPMGSDFTVRVFYVPPPYDADKGPNSIPPPEEAVVINGQGGTIKLNGSIDYKPKPTGELSIVIAVEKLGAKSFKFTGISIVAVPLRPGDGLHSILCLKTDGTLSRPTLVQPRNCQRYFSGH